MGSNIISILETFMKCQTKERELNWLNLLFYTVIMTLRSGSDRWEVIYLGKKANNQFL